MAKPKANGKPLNSPKTRTATSPEARENQLISLAYDLVEQRLRDGTATSQETVHFLKLGSTKDRIEKEILERQKTNEVNPTVAPASSLEMISRQQQREKNPHRT